MLSRKNLLLIAILCVSHFAYSQTATIRGNIFDRVSRDGLPGAFVSIRGTNFRTAADDKGNFLLKGIPAGEYDIILENVGYLPVTQHIVLHPGENFKLFFGLTLQPKALGEVIVIGLADREKEIGSRDREKYAPGVINVISSEAMARSPDINAANVLQRMSGITVQRSDGGDEAYAVIRGMEPRYNNTLVNGIKIASPDNKNRFVQLDIIPSDILSSIEISKSLTPDMEGDAIGGTVNMVVKDAPQASSFKATASIGYSQLFFDEKYMDFAKGGIQRLSPIQRNPPGYVIQPTDFPRSNLDFEPKQAPPTGILGFSFTHRYFHNRVGLVLADNLQNQYYGNISTQFTVTPGGSTSDSLEATGVTNYSGYTQQLNNGLVAHIDYVFNDRNRVNIDNFYVYSYEAQAVLSQDTTLIGTGRTVPGTGQIFPNGESLTQFQHIENIKVSGRHVLSPHLSLDWAGVLSDAGRRLPDLANVETDYRIQYNFTRTVTLLDHISHQWFNNDDKDYTGILNLDYRHKWMGYDLELKAGGLYRTKTRYNDEDDYTLEPTLDSNGIKQAWTNIYQAQYMAFNATAPTVYNPNDYKADETVFAEYAMARYVVGDVELGGGLRVENTSTDWNVKIHGYGTPNSGNQTYQDMLPSAYLKYRFSSKSALHLSYFKSISRPNYYELVPAPTRAADWITEGNPSLLHAVADNYDIRYELFPKGEEHLFLGAFYKVIQDPIELLLTNAGQGLFDYKPQNSGTATNFGGELSFTQYWGKFGLTGNYTYTHSVVNSQKITYQGKLVIEQRPMQGQTAHVANVSLLYKDVKHGFFAQLAYEYQGKTLAQTSLYYQSDYYQQPLNTLAFSLEKDVHKHVTLFGKFNNLLNTPTREYVQSTLTSQDIYKATYSIGIRYAR